MKLKISNLAQIKEAIIEDSDFTVIAGDNGTGKTLLLETVSLIKRYFSEELDKIIKNFLDESSPKLNINTDLNSIVKYYKSKQIMLNNDGEQDKKGINLEAYGIDLQLNDVEQINLFFNTKFNSMYSKVIELINERVLFGDKPSTQIELLELPEMREEYSLKISFGITSNMGIISCEIEGEQQNNTSDFFPLNSYKKENDFIENDFINAPFETYLSSFPSAEEFKGIITEKIKYVFLKHIYTNYFGKGDLLFLPSERNLYMDNALRKTLNENYTNTKMRYSEHLFNQAYLEFQDVYKRFSSLYKYMQNEELQSLFGGELRFTENGEIESVIKTNGEIVKRELFSTKQSRLIPYLIIYQPLKTYKQIIIEEPEAHLSLRSMNQFLNYIKSLIDGSRKICLTTHSDVFFTRLNNFLLTNNKISAKVYEFKEIEGRSILEEKNKTEYGYEIDLFSNELNNVYEETVKVQKRDLDG
ncbi:hypothetical protein DN398_26380 [Bacillus sp. JAS102]|uniref:AAA family ATPase n=1 Tax=Bacillus sp. JAS102 TaxID=2217824 RepID=UPI0011F007CF|nr:AAA family ATPase [Bacillus sp. JAS102]KAA0796442.1 hypothetical protein DN398_26380 [Bacillus sp. JAS102]